MIDRARYAQLLSFGPFQTLVPREHKTETKLRGFTKLAPGWHYGTGVPLSEDRLAQAIKLHNYLIQVGFTQTDAFPGAEGDVLLTAYHDKYYIAICINIEGRYDFLLELDKTELIDQNYINFEQVRTTLASISEAIWPSYGSSILDISTGSSAVSTAWPFEKAVIKVRPSSALSAWRPKQGVFVITSESSTNLPFQETLQFSGSSTKTSSRRSVA